MRLGVGRLLRRQLLMKQPVLEGFVGRGSSIAPPIQIGIGPGGLGIRLRV
jgi:hypothetical protein